MRAPEARVVFRSAPPQGRRGGIGLALLWSLTAIAGALVLFFGGVLVGRVIEPARTVVAEQPAAEALPAAAGSGPTRRVRGVPVGYPRTKEGAVSAATNYYLLLSSPMIFDDARRRAAIAILAAPGSRTALQRQYDQAVPRIRRNLGLGSGAVAVIRSVPVGFRVDGYDGLTAEVTIWSAGFVGSSGGAPVQEAWGVTTVSLQWTDGDWKQVRLADQRPLVPLTGAQVPSPATEFVDQARRFQEYRHGT